MKTTKLAVIAMVAILAIGTANNVLADATVNGDGSNALDSHIENTNTNTNTNDQTQDQIQDQQQEQTQTSSGNATVNYNAPGTVIAPVALPGVVGGHPGSPAVVMYGGAGGIVGGQSLANGSGVPSYLDGWIPFVCRPLFQVYTKDRIYTSAVDSKFGERKGGFFHRLWHDPSSNVPHTSAVVEPDGKPVVVLNWQPAGQVIHQGDVLLGEFACEGDYGQPQGAALGRCLEAAVSMTNTHRVSAYYKIRRDPKSSGMSIGSGGAIGGIIGTAGGVITTGGLVGTTSSYNDEATDWYLYALNDGPVEAPVGAEMCGQVSQQQPKAQLQKCDLEKVRKEIADAEKAIENCKFWSRQNLENRAHAQYLYEKLHNCMGKTDKSLLDKSAVHAAKAQENYDEVHKNPKSRAVSQRDWDESHALKVLGNVQWNEAALIREKQGRDSEISYAQDHGMEFMPQSIEEIKPIN